MSLYQESSFFKDGDMVSIVVEEDTVSISVVVGDYCINRIVSHEEKMVSIVSDIGSAFTKEDMSLLRSSIELTGHWTTAESTCRSI
mgnify:CR=1 FL=1